MAAPKDANLRCTLCLSNFTKPKLLPCFHTFCEPCLSDLASRSGGRTFLCPMCRKNTQVPKGGVSSFQTNFYIDTGEDQSQSRCSEHPAKQLDLYCSHCKVPLCVKCMFSSHKQHEIQDISETAKSAKQQLSHFETTMARLQRDQRKNLKVLKLTKTLLTDRKMSLETEIKSRHAQIVSAADKIRDKALAELETQVSYIQTTSDEAITDQQICLEKTDKLCNQIAHAMEGSDLEQVRLAKELTCGNGVEQIHTHSEQQILLTGLPKMRFSKQPASLNVQIGDFFTVATTEYMISLQNVVQSRFHCNVSASDISSICPLQSGDVLISFRSHSGTDDIAAQQLNDGRSVPVALDVKGMVTFKNVFDDEYIYLSQAGKKRRTFAKSKACMFLETETGVSSGSIYRVHVTSRKTLTTSWEPICSISSSYHRAFDVSSKEDLFVVLEEGRESQPGRVKLYQFPQSEPTAIYAPPLQAFQPADVCFYTLDGKEGLLVADELNSAIHVVSVEKAQLTPSRYFVKDCALLKQPVALNMDSKGRLWVACRAGHVLTCTPVTNAGSEK